MATDKADLVLENIAVLATPTRLGLHKGREQGAIRVIRDALIAITESKITWVGPRREWKGKAKKRKDLEGRAVVPGLVDPHTHAIWAGDRYDDFEAQMQGIPYEEILQRGGGIYHTVRAVWEATPRELTLRAILNVSRLFFSGATTIEVKSGYGLDVEDEFKLLYAIHDMPELWQEMHGQKPPPTVVPTLLVHVPPLDMPRSAYLKEVCEYLIPSVAKDRLAVAVDIFVEQSAFTVEEAEQVLQCAQQHGLGIKVHADQFHSIGGVELAVRLGALSVDHLEVSGEVQIRALAESNTVGVLLPGVSLHLGLPPAPARALIEAGAGIAIGTDLNPGSSPLYSTQLALALGVRLYRLTLAEALIAGTVNSASALGLADRGALVPNARADLLVLRSYDWRDLLYGLGDETVHQIYVKGSPVFPYR